MRLLAVKRILGAFIITACAIASANADQNTGVIRGYVYVAHTKTPVCGIRVYADSDNETQTSTVTDANGFFVFISRRTGTVHVYADDPNPFSERMVDVHPNFYAEPILYVDRRVRTMSSKCGAAMRRLP